MISETVNEIHGLDWESNWRIENGQDSYVVPFATIRPVNIVFHGEEKFDYAQYGIHLGQEDNLTFLGPSTQIITGQFIDCRRNSPTLHKRVTAQWNPTSQRFLRIPPGVAHAFDSLENIFTINAYKQYLPDPNVWLAGQTAWNAGSDVVNFEMDVTDDLLPIVEPNQNEASDVFYQLIAENQRNTLPDLNHEYPTTNDVALDDGTEVRLMFKKISSASSSIPEWEPIAGIDGAGWVRHLLIPSGDKSGYVPLLDARPLYIVDHGEVQYSHDAYGIHLGQRDCLTFLGPASQLVNLTMTDCRNNSPTFHNTVSLQFTPNALRYLIIPNGVAHRFERLENVFTVNRPVLFVDNEGSYEPGNDVIDWPIDRQPFPKLEINTIPARQEFYINQMLAQKELQLAPPMHATPMVLLTKDRQGSPIRVALRKMT